MAPEAALNVLEMRWRSGRCVKKVGICDCTNNGVSRLRGKIRRCGDSCFQNIRLVIILRAG